MNAEIRRRFKWVKLYEELGDVGVVCRRCGISLGQKLAYLKFCLIAPT